MWTLLITLGVLAQGYGAMFALLGRFRDDYGISETRLGLIVGVGFFTAFVAQLLIAPQADKGHARLLLLGGVSLNAVGNLVMAFSDTFGGLFVGRVLMGIGIGAGYPAVRRAVAMAEPDRVGANSGLVLSADVVGFLAGPVIALMVVGPFGLSAPFWAGVGLSLAALLMAWRVPMGDVVNGGTTQRLAVGLLREPWMQAAACYGVAFFLMVGTFDALWAVRLTDLLGEGNADVYVQLGIVIFAAPMVLFARAGGAFSEARGPFVVGALGLINGCVFVALYGLIGVPWVLVAIGMVHATNDAFSAPSVPIAVTHAAPEERLGGAQGLVGALQTLTGGVASIAGGALYDAWGPVAAYGTASGAMLVIVALGWNRYLAYRRQQLIPQGGIVAGCTATTPTATVT